MPIVFFLTYKQFQMVDLIMLNTKLRCLWPELLLTVQQLQGPSLTDLQNLTCLQSSLHSPQVLLSGMKTDKTMLIFHPKENKILKTFQKSKAQELLSTTSYNRENGSLFAISF